MNHAELLPVYNETLVTMIENEGNIIHKTADSGQKVLALVKQDEWNGENEVFLKKILASCNLNDNDYIIALTGNEGNIFEIISRYAPEVLFLFGVKLESGFFKPNKNIYKPFTFNHIKIVLSDTLAVIKSDKDKRLLLWNQCIKPLFNIA